MIFDSPLVNKLDLRVLVMSLPCDVILLYDITMGQLACLGLCGSTSWGWGCPLLDFIHGFAGEAHQTLIAFGDFIV